MARFVTIHEVTNRFNTEYGSVQAGGRSAFWLRRNGEVGKKEG